MALVFSHLMVWAPESSLVAHVNRAINGRPEHAAGCHLLSVVQAATNTVAASQHFGLFTVDFLVKKIMLEKIVGVLQIIDENYFLWTIQKL